MQNEKVQQKNPYIYQKDDSKVREATQRKPYLLKFKVHIITINLQHDLSVSQYEQRFRNLCFSKSRNNLDMNGLVKFLNLKYSIKILLYCRNATSCNCDRWVVDHIINQNGMQKISIKKNVIAQHFVNTQCFQSYI